MTESPPKGSQPGDGSSAASGGAPTSPPATPRGASELALRFLSAGLIVPPLVFICYLGGWPFVAVIVAVACIGVNEFYRFILAKGASPHRIFGTIAAACAPVVAFAGDAALATSFLTVVLLATLVLQLGKSRIDHAIASISATFFGVFYVGWLLSHAVFLRTLPADARIASAGLPDEAGFFLVILTIAAAVGSDTGGFFAGRAFGAHKLAPAISPGKTIEGAIGALAAGVVFAVATKAVFDLAPGGLAAGLPYGTTALLGAAIAAASIVGDLIESLLKRDAHVKDAGHIIPGVGGVLDRIDSALLAFPVMYYLLLGYYRLAAA